MNYSLKYIQGERYKFTVRKAVFVLYSEEKNKIVGGTLYVVATPIGNLSDISERAVKVLSGVSFIAAEDTRNTLKLLGALGISASLVSYHEHNRAEAGERIAERLLSGESCALVTDAGTPAISDPGEHLVSLCAERGIPVTSVPGACACITALTLSALPTSRFVFEGFLPVKGKERRERLSELSGERRTFVLHEAPHKLISTLKDLAEVLGGERRISLCREMTKLNEEVMRCTLDEALAYYGTNAPRGEYVLVIEGAKETQQTQADMSPKEAIDYYVASGLPKKEAIKAAAKLLDIPKNEVYRASIEE